MWRVEVTSEAELEIFEAALRSERERTGLGFRFEAQVNAVFTKLLDNPFHFRTIEPGVRRLAWVRFTRSPLRRSLRSAHRVCTQLLAISSYRNADEIIPPWKLPRSSFSLGA